jgi:hypothetical protein
MKEISNYLGGRDHSSAWAKMSKPYLEKAQYKIGLTE